MKREEKFEKIEHEPLTPEEAEMLWKNVFVRIRKMEQKKRRRQMGVVVSLLLISGIIGFAGYDRYIRPEVYMAELVPLDVKLKDGTNVRLLEGGKLTVGKFFPGKIREVVLEGSGVFRVAKSKEHAFVVRGTGYNTKVLGTVFKVVQKNGAFKLDLYEGKVSISKDNDRNAVYTLGRNETFNNYGSEKIVAITHLKQEDVSTSIPGEGRQPGMVTLQFDESRFSDIINVLEQVYHVKVKYPQGYRDRLVTISLIEKSPDAVLQNLAFLMHLQLQRNGTIYQLEE